MKETIEDKGYEAVENQARPTLMRDMAVDERPREKAIRHGIKTLTDAELMAILFSTGSAGVSVLDMCRNILRDHDNHLSRVARQSAAYLSGKYRGVGLAKAVTLLAALELGARASSDAARSDNPVIANAAIAADCMRHHFANLSHEEVWIMHLNTSGKIIAEERVSEGGLSSTMVDIRKILKSALDHYSSAVLMFHNHPSGALSPSVPDDQLTNKVKEGCRAIDIRFNDHIIITENGYYSYHDAGRL